MEFEKAKEFILDKLQKELSQNLYYHSYQHVMDVYQAAQMLSAHEGIDGEDLTLLLTAVLFHDSGFTIQNKNHEELGCDIAREALPRFNYSAEQVEKICGMIMATKIPQTPHNLMEEIICDADLDYLGRDDFFPIGNNLFNELCMYGILNDEKAWNRLQVSFLKGHHYFTKTAKQLRDAKKQSHLDYIEQLVATY